MKVQQIIDPLNAAINSGKIKPTDEVLVLTITDDGKYITGETYNLFLEGNAHNTWVEIECEL